jgi:predicted enzyme related to lactoylglutathione lyase
MTALGNSLVWVDIPVLNLDRAISFYSAMLGQAVTRQGGPGFAFGLLPGAEPGVRGCLYEPQSDNHPSRVGPLIYLNAEGRLHEAIKAVRDQGGAVIQAVHAIGEHGWRALVIDSEGNRLALHSFRP